MRQPAKVTVTDIGVKIPNVMIPTITANVASWLIVNRDAFTDEEQEEVKEILRELQAILRVLHATTGETPPTYMTNEELLKAAETTAEMN